MTFPGIIIPSKKAGSLKSENGGDFVWPEGAYKGTFDVFEIRPLPSTADGKPFAGYATTDGERLSVQIGNIVPLEDQQGIGARKFFLDLALQDGKVSLSEFASAPTEAWQLERSARYIANIAAALNSSADTDDGNVVVDEAFIDALRNGDFTGTEIGFVIYHKPNKKDKNKPYQEIETFVAVS